MRPSLHGSLRRGRQPSYARLGCRIDSATALEPDEKVVQAELDCDRVGGSRTPTSRVLPILRDPVSKVGARSHRGDIRSGQVHAADRNQSPGLISPARQASLRQIDRMLKRRRKPRERTIGITVKRPGDAEPQ